MIGLVQMLLVRGHREGGREGERERERKKERTGVSEAWRIPGALLAEQDATGNWRLGPLGSRQCSGPKLLCEPGSQVHRFMNEAIFEEMRCETRD